MNRIYYSIADANNLKYYKLLENSFNYFNPKEELILIGEEEIKAANDPNFFYRATPAINKMLFNKGYKEICKIDSDSIVTGNIDSIWEGEWDIACVHNSNPREMKAYPVGVWDIHPLTYLNCGFVVMKSKEFNEQWLKLCYSPHFENYQMREQDLLNIMVYYMNRSVGGNYNIKLLDAGDSFFGLSSKGYWPQITIQKNKLILHPQNDKDITYPPTSKWIKVIHAAGGDVRDKWKFDVQFSEEVSKWLKKVTKGEN